MSHKPALQLDNFPLNRECSGNPVCWEQTQLTVDATEADEHYRTLSWVAHQQRWASLSQAHIAQVKSRSSKGEADSRWKRGGQTLPHPDKKVNMSHWFHRNPLKATGLQNFEIKMFAHDSDALKVITNITLGLKVWDAVTQMFRLCPTWSNPVPECLSYYQTLITQ